MLERSAKKLLGIGSLLCMLFILVGCKIDGEEEIEIHDNGALTMRVNYQIPELGLSLEDGRLLVEYIQAFAFRHESISVNELSCEPSGNSTVRLIAEIHSSDALKLQEIMEAETIMFERDDSLDLELFAKLKAIIGEISIGVEGTNIIFNRAIVLGELLENGLPTLNPLLLGNYQFRYSLTSPRAAAHHNATTTSNNGKTLTWVMPLKHHVSTPFIMQATLPIPIPWWVWLLVGLAILLLLWMLRKIFRYVRLKFDT
ncbi:MAG: hypothetical protein ACSHX6_02985 [Akkermansiaceae bacterium]